MAWRLTYFEEVAGDIRDAKEWYKEQQSRLERRFATEVKATIRRVVTIVHTSRNPKIPNDRIS